jgi:hypothetical protein
MGVLISTFKCLCFFMQMISHTSYHAVTLGCMAQSFECSCPPVLRCLLLCPVACLVLLQVHMLAMRLQVLLQALLRRAHRDALPQIHGMSLQHARARLRMPAKPLPSAMVLPSVLPPQGTRRVLAHTVDLPAHLSTGPSTPLTSCSAGTTFVKVQSGPSLLPYEQQQPSSAPADQSSGRCRGDRPHVATCPTGGGVLGMISSSHPGCTGSYYTVLALQHTACGAAPAAATVFSH